MLIQPGYGFLSGRLDHSDVAISVFNLRWCQKFLLLIDALCLTFLLSALETGDFGSAWRVNTASDVPGRWRPRRSIIYL